MFPVLETLVWCWRPTLFPVLETLVCCWRPTVLEAIHVTSPGLSPFLCYFAERLSRRVLGEGTCCSGRAWVRDGT